MTTDRVELAVRELVAALRDEVRPPPEPAPFLTLAEAARQLRISRTSLYGLLDRGDLPSRKVGRRRLVPRAAVEAMASEEASGAAEAAPDGRAGHRHHAETGPGSYDDARRGAR